MRCNELETVLEAEGLGPLSSEAREHLADCPSCQGFLADLHSIVNAAHTLPAEVTPPDRVWISLRAQLEAEGLIKQEELVEVSEPAPWWQSFSGWFQPRVLATAAIAALLVVATVYLTHMPSGVQQPIATVQSPAQSSAPQQAAALPPAPVPAAVPSLAPAVSAKANTSSPMPSKIKELAPSPSETASSTLTQAELSLPDMQLAGNSRVDASMRENLRTLNEFIAECEKHLKQNPQDQLAREYLYTAYQQKADLLAAMMDSGRSEH